MKLMFLITVIFLSLSVNANTPNARFLLATFNTRTALPEQLAAAKTLLQYSGETQVQRQLLNLLQTSATPVALKIAAVESLCFQAINSNISRELLRSYGVERDLQLKVAIVKSLFLATNQNRDARNFVTRVLQNEEEPVLSEAAIFALASISGDQQVARLLTNIMTDSRSDEIVRVAAIKALFWQRNLDLQRELIRLISNVREVTSVRVAGLQLLRIVWAASNSKDNFFSDLAENDASSDVRLAALDALRPQLEERDIRWFKLYRNPVTGALRNPLED